MQICYITTLTMTRTLRGKGILEGQGIRAEALRLPPHIATEGCAFGMALEATLAGRAKQILDRAGFPYGKILTADGRPLPFVERVGQPPAVSGMPRTTIPPQGGRR